MFTCIKFIIISIPIVLVVVTLYYNKLISNHISGDCYFGYITKFSLGKKN